MTREEFNEALRSAVSGEFEYIANDTTAEHIFSKKFEKRMNRLIKSVKKHATTPLKAFAKNMSTAAALILVIIVTTTQVRAIREPISNLMTKIYDIYMEITFEGDTSTSINHEYMLGYVPNDFFLTDTYKSNNLLSYTYTNPSKESIEFSQGITQDTLSFIDNESTTSKILDITGIEVTLYKLENISFVQWIQDSYFMLLTCTGEFEESEIIKMVEAVQPIE